MTIMKTFYILCEKNDKIPKAKINYEEDMTDEENDDAIDGGDKKEDAKIEESIEKKTVKKTNKRGIKQLLIRLIR